jgi:UDP-glucose 4-epimerase
MHISSTDKVDILTLAKVARDEIDPSLDIEFTDLREADAEHTRRRFESGRTDRLRTEARHP